MRRDMLRLQHFAVEQTRLGEASVELTLDSAREGVSAMLQEGYPGVHIMEVPSGVRTIVGASTSNLATVGHFPRGPVDEAVRVTSWGDVERIFGGLDRRFLAPYALQEFYQQGGSTAYVVRIAFQNATVVLNTTEAALEVAANTGGAAGNNLRVGFSHNNDGSFDMVVAESNAVNAPRVVFTNLSATVGDAGFAETRLNAPPALGGSSLVNLSAVRHRPAQTLAGTAASALAPAQMIPLADGADPDVRARLLPMSGPLPALTLQSMTAGAAANAFTAAVAVTDAVNGIFTITFTGASAPAPLTNLTIDPASADYVVTRLAAAGFAGVVVGRHPLRVPVATAAVPFAGSGAPVPSALVDLPRAGAGNAMCVTAANPGSWGNSLRVGAALTATGGFDLLIAEFLGSERVRAETFRNLNLTPNDPANALTVINSQSQLIRLSALTALPRETVAATRVDDLTFAQMTPLAGGQDGVLPGEPAWAGAAAPASSRWMALCRKFSTSWRFRKHR
jgi:uncharacterized protein